MTLNKTFNFSLVPSSLRKRFHPFQTKKQVDKSSTIQPKKRLSPFLIWLHHFLTLSILLHFWNLLNHVKPVEASCFPVFSPVFPPKPSQRPWPRYDQPCRIADAAPDPRISRWEPRRSESLVLMFGWILGWLFFVCFLFCWFCWLWCIGM